MRERNRHLGPILVLAIAVAAAGIAAAQTAVERGKPQPPPSTANPAIAYMSYSSWARADLMVMDADGANQRMILNGVKAPGYGHYSPQWSPSGEWIVIGRTDGECTSTSEGIFMVKKDGTGLCLVGLMVNPPISHGAPQWSPDGLRLIYSDSVPPLEWGSSLFMYDAVCGSPTRVHIDHPLHGYFGCLTLSPDGGRLAAVATDEPVPPATEPTWGLFVYGMTRDEEGRWLKAVPMIELTAAGPLKGAGIGGVDWAHDPLVDKLVVAANPTGQNDLYLIDLRDPFNPVNISNTPDLYESAPCWSPLDDQIVYVRNGSIYKMNADGSDVKLMATPARGRRLDQPAWRHNP